MPSTPPQTISMTGGRGRLASLVSDHFRAPAYNVKPYSRTAGPGFTALESLLEPDVLATAGTIFHLAWSSLPATSEKHPGIEQTHDLPFLDRLLTALATNPETRKTRLVFFSTGGAVYGNAPGRANHEGDPCHPIGAYGRFKLAAEQMINERAPRDGLTCTVLRISNPYGYPVPPSRAQGLIPHALRCSVSNQPFNLWGDGTTRKDFLYYTDFLSALELVMAAHLTGTYNLCAGRSHQISEVIKRVETEAGHPITQVHTPAPAWDVHDSRLTNAKFRAATGWQPQVDLAEGIRRSAAGYLEH
ncbi:MAG: NAD-dependent epimerase/dehydratase family protein [Cephaloticoccus sp.]|nr:NAD-dependent epimerase/dehydratase family protein [Cephaloticoccus sp.]MCF7760825.1 NAD-dependent epimerase/dehydratase family protein [Cephaloticoccus sp.]